jgi:hypothetical protein
MQKVAGLAFVNIDHETLTQNFIAPQHHSAAPAISQPVQVKWLRDLARRLLQKRI